MDCYVRPANSSWDGRFKGFAVYKESARATAETWAGNRGRLIQIPDTLEDCGIDGYDDRMNNKVFKVFYPMTLDGKIEKIYFDMYADALVDLLMNGEVENGIIKTPLTFISRGKLVIVGGTLYQAEQERENAKLLKKIVKKIPQKEIEVGQMYAKTPGADNMYIYLGKIDKKHYEIISYYRYTSLNELLKDVSMKSYQPSYQHSNSAPTYKEKVLDSDGRELKVPLEFIIKGIEYSVTRWESCVKEAYNEHWRKRCEDELAVGKAILKHLKEINKMG